MKTTFQGSLYLETKDKVIMQLDNVKVVPGIAKDIISIGQLIKAGNKVEMGWGQILLRNPFGNKILIEAKKVNPTEGKHEAFSVSNNATNDIEREWTKVKSKQTSKAKKVIDINDAHELYGHVSEGPLRAALLE